MKMTLKIMGCLSALALCACGEPSPACSESSWEEPADPTPVDTAVWRPIIGTHASFGSADVRYPRSQPYEGELCQKARLTGWRGETLAAQLVVWTADSLAGLSCTVDDFESAGRNKLRDITRARFVRYVLADEFDPAKPCGARPEGAYPALLQPDMLDDAAVLDLAARSLRPVWISVAIPRDAQPGLYRSEVKLRAQGGFETSLELELDVIDRMLPPASEWSYHLDLWQHPSAVAYAEGVEMWSDEHFRRMEPTMRLLAEAGQKVITANVNKDPWNCQTHYPYDDMIAWTRFGDGSWEYDFTVFDRWVEFMMGLGINKFINCYSLLPWNNELHYTDAVTGETVTVSAAPSEPLFREIWTPFLTAFTGHLRQKGWLSITNIAMDERSDADMDAAVALLSEVAPELGISLADDKFIFRKYPHIKDMCVGIFADMDPADIAQRRSKGLVSTCYVCCSSGFPNTYTSSEPLEAVYLSWFAKSRDYDGFLRWAYNAWTADPLCDTRFRTWTAGDTFLVYPEGRSSIRFERLREGIQDWEKITILRRELASDNSVEAAGKLLQLDDAVARFGTNLPAEEWQQELNAAKSLLNELSR